jgi:hypothetical protein
MFHLSPGDALVFSSILLAGGFLSSSLSLTSMSLPSLWTSIRPPESSLSPFSFLLSPFSFLLSPFSFLLSPFSFLLSPFSFLLSPSSFLLPPFSFFPFLERSSPCIPPASTSIYLLCLCPPSLRLSAASLSWSHRFRSSAPTPL